MKKTYKLQNLGCAHCAAKMEAGIKKLEGVRDASINFMAAALRLTQRRAHLKRFFRMPRLYAEE
jgi:copper chaperone CopZ